MDVESSARPSYMYNKHYEPLTVRVNVCFVCQGARLVSYDDVAEEDDGDAGKEKVPCSLVLKDGVCQSCHFRIRSLGFSPQINSELLVDPGYFHRKTALLNLLQLLDSSATFLHPHLLQELVRVVQV